MIEQIQLVRRYGRMLWPYRWTTIIIATLAAIGGSIYVFTIPPIYQVNARIFVDTESMLRPLMQGLAVQNQSVHRAAVLMKRTLLTRPNIEKVAREADLDLNAKDARQFDNIVTNLITNIKISGTSRSHIFGISYTDKDPQKAKRIVDELLNAFLETALGSGRTDAVTTQKFIDEQIQEYEKRLIEAEERLREFKQRNVGMMPDSGGNHFSRMQSARAQLEHAELALKEAIQRRDELNKQLKDTLTMQSESGEMTSVLRSKYSDRIGSMEEQLDSLLLQYTDKHPEILGLKSTLETLKKRHAEEIKRLAEESLDGGAIPQTNSTSGAIRLALGDASATAAALQTRVTQYKKKVAELERLVDTVPEIEAELVRLDRDYGLNRKRHQALLAKRESARLAQEVEQKGDSVKLKVIEPPRVPLLPTGPDRVKYLSMTFLGAFGFGLGVAFLLSQLNPRFYASDELKEFAQIPVLGAISRVSTSRQKNERRMELVVFITVLLGFFALYGGVTTLELMQVDVHGKLIDVLGQK